MNGYILSRWCPRNSTVLSVCSGSGSMAEAAVCMGRSCISIEIDGSFLKFTIDFFPIEYQFHQSARRLKEVYETAMRESTERGMDYNKYCLIFSFLKF